MKMPLSSWWWRFHIGQALNSLWETRHDHKIYTAPCVHDENGLAQRGWRTIVTMKDSMLINSSLPNGFWTEAMETANYLQNRLPDQN